MNPPPTAPFKRKGFTLIEVVVVVGVIALLLALLLPSLAGAREQARVVSCSSNIRQIVVANQMYADESGGTYVPGAADFISNLNRWHGRREQSNEPFDPARGPLASYLGDDGAIRSCPSFREPVENPAQAFELGAGGYGYNSAFLGVRLVSAGPGYFAIDTDLVGVRTSRVRRAGETVMFTDAAFAASGLIEYSFAEPRFMPTNGFRPDPSIHFRHGHRVNVAWVDGHVDARRRTFTWSSGLYSADPDRLGLGWFGEADDNSLFDLQ